MSKPTPDTRLTRQVGHALQQARLHRNVTQAELAAALGVRRVTVSRWERGERSPDITTLLAIAHRLHIDPATLLPASPPPMAEQPSTAHRTEIAPVVAQAIALLHQHPTLAASVIELIEMMAETADDPDDAPSTAAD